MSARKKRQQVDLGDPVARGHWLTSVRARAEQIVATATWMLCPPAEWAVYRPTFDRKIKEASTELRRLLEAAGAYPPRVPELRWCRKCASAPFDASVCPECGDADWVRPWPP
jgi:hypothetical protein